MNTTSNSIDILLETVLKAADKRDFSGYGKFDALNSPLLHTLSFNNKWLRLVLTQLVKESPVNLRSLLAVKTSRNPKGIALFARAYLYQYERNKDSKHLKKAEKLFDWLLQHPSPNQPHLCWGYNYIWQSPLFLQKKFEPNAVVTVFVGEALLHAYRVTQNETYLKAARSVGDFISRQLPVLHETTEERAIAYVLSNVKAIVLNNQVLTGAFLTKLWKHTKDKQLLNIAKKQFAYTVNRKTDYYAWYYTYPALKSHIKHDNYHTGGILDALIEFYEETGNDIHLNTYWQGLTYYRDNLFENNGAPRWMNDMKFPHDVHGAAQGIITFSKAARHQPEYLLTAKKIVDWSAQNLYCPERHTFIYRIGRFYKWNYSLMRWCNGWMTRALAEFTSVSKKEEDR